MEMEMEMEMDTGSFYQHLELSPPPCSGQALSYYYPPLGGDMVPAAAHVQHVRSESERPTPAGASASARVARKDRHSKICTAGGMRDRRMRLSLDVARRFFALQDKLGFDKASKTVQWLLDMSTPGIKGLTSAMSMSMSMSEDGSVLLDNDQMIMMADSADRNKQRSSNKARSKLKQPPPRKSNAAGAAGAVPDKESRARARERARERTRERNRLRSLPAPASLQLQAPLPLPLPLPLPAGSGSSFVEHGGSYYEQQEPWELSGVVFAKARFHY